MNTPYSAYAIVLSEQEREELASLIRRGRISARVVTRALTLKQLDEGESPVSIAQHLGICDATVRNISRRYLVDGLHAALYDLPRPGQPKHFSDKEIQQITALVCSPPPQGFSRWTLHRLVDEIQQQNITTAICHETVRRIFKNHDLRPWREKNVVRSNNNKRVSPSDGRRPGALRTPI